MSHMAILQQLPLSTRGLRPNATQCTGRDEPGSLHYPLGPKQRKQRDTAKSLHPPHAERPEQKTPPTRGRHRTSLPMNEVAVWAMELKELFRVQRQPIRPGRIRTGETSANVS